MFPVGVQVSVAGEKTLPRYQPPAMSTEPSASRMARLRHQPVDMLPVRAQPFVAGS
jgi:hypothetical protein